MTVYRLDLSRTYVRTYSNAFPQAFLQWLPPGHARSPALSWISRLLRHSAGISPASNYCHALHIRLYLYNTSIICIGATVYLNIYSRADFFLMAIMAIITSAMAPMSIHGHTTGSSASGAIILSIDVLVPAMP